MLWIRSNLQFRFLTRWPFHRIRNKALDRKEKKREHQETSSRASVSSNKKALTAHEENWLDGDSNRAELFQTVEPSRAMTDSRAEKPIGRSFPEKVLEIIENPQNKEVIWWNQAGTAICISPKNFHSQVMDTHFQGTKFDSFARRLTRHGFSRIPDDHVPPGTHVYFHDFFIRGQPELMEQMKGGERYERPVAKECKKRRDPDEEATSGMVTLSSLYSSSESGSKTRTKDSSEKTMLMEEARSGKTLLSLHSTESAVQKASSASLLNEIERSNMAAKNELEMKCLSRLHSTVAASMPSASTALTTLRNETANLASVDPQVQQQLLSQLLFRQNSQQQLLHQHYNVQIANELTKRRLMLDFAGQCEPYRGSGSGLLPMNAFQLLNTDPLLPSHLQFQQHALSSIVSRHDQLEQPPDAQTLQIQLLREKQRQNDLLRVVRRNW